ncbi:GNAT family protein [Saccharibacillus sp. CPCC 101409]|uniref:GNAT family N-acetyltransferase n=1 Tax=Saccharibacillus sp. CPCC 101409 TaxID=3058041 RepID=UPI002670F64B|nr:GNAT family protein [Saccharibacillus sp. CPCC 101409]MDO3410930.1 GNAT family protein [Saccharibacillus sp. CPCC 101409]
MLPHIHLQGTHIHLQGTRVELIPLEEKHIEELFVSSAYPEIWTYLPKKVQRLEEMRQIVHDALSMKAKGLEYPFAVYDKELRRIVGSTRFLNLSLENKNLEIGWTWYIPEVWRTRVNTESKYLLLKYGFEELELVRVQLKADIRNERSNNAIERIGAVREGTLRQDRILHDGYTRSSHLYSILDSEWPGVKKKLEGYLET